MKDMILAGAIIIAAIAATALHHSLNRLPLETLSLRSFFYEQTGLTINFPEEATVRIYSGYVLIERPDGLVTMVPNHRIHAIDAFPL